VCAEGFAAHYRHQALSHNYSVI